MPAAQYVLERPGPRFPAGTVPRAVVDPGVGSERRALAAAGRGHGFIAPDNGLLTPMLAGATVVALREPADAAPTFHGRDLFAPVAARVAKGDAPPGRERAPSAIGGDWPDDLARIVYVDHFGNAMTGLRAAGLAQETRLVAQGRTLSRARTFADVPEGTAFWYENANGLAEIAVSKGRADAALDLAVGTEVEVV